MSERLIKRRLASFQKEADAILQRAYKVVLDNARVTPKQDDAYFEDALVEKITQLDAEWQKIFKSYQYFRPNKRSTNKIEIVKPSFRNHLVEEIAKWTDQIIENVRIKYVQDYLLKKHQWTKNDYPDLKELYKKYKTTTVLINQITRIKKNENPV